MNHDPDAHDIAEMARMSAWHVRRFGIEPKIAIVSSHSDFGTDDSPSSCKMREALRILGEDRAVTSRSTARCRPTRRLVQAVRDRVLPGSTLKGEANILVMPNIDAANIAYQLTKGHVRRAAGGGRS